jgi:Uma2 family endonuclease
MAESLETRDMNVVKPLNPSSLYGRLLALRENLVGEIIGGELYTQPRPGGRHGMAEIGLGTILLTPFHRGQGGPGGWWILPEPEIHFVRDIEVAVPDLAGWRRERMPELPEGHRFEVVPDWVCEILSPSTANKDRTLKLPFYAGYKVSHAWLVDPEARTLEAFSLREGRWSLIAMLKDDDPVRIPPFDAISFSLADLWA